ncbi:MAG: cell division protein ZapA [Clostridiales bacterium]|nr:cell division protein ZapA [Clostridiales bacterium]
MGKNRISVIIDGSTYNVISDDDEMHVLAIAEMLDRQIRDVKKNTNSLTSSMVLVLSAMNIADEFIKFKDIINNSERVQTRNNALELMEKQIKNLRNELQNTQVTLGKSNEEVIFLQKKLTDKEEEFQSLKYEQQNLFENNNAELQERLKALENENDLKQATIDEANE